MTERNTRTRMAALFGHDLFAPHLWQRRIALWSGGIAVGLAAIVFARASDFAFAGFRHLLAISPWLPLIVTPLAFALLQPIWSRMAGPPETNPPEEKLHSQQRRHERFREAVMGGVETSLVERVGQGGGLVEGDGWRGTGRPHLDRARNRLSCVPRNRRCR